MSRTKVLVLVLFVCISSFGCALYHRVQSGPNTVAGAPSVIYGKVVETTRYYNGLYGYRQAIVIADAKDPENRSKWQGVVLAEKFALGEYWDREVAVTGSWQALNVPAYKKRLESLERRMPNLSGKEARELSGLQVISAAQTPVRTLEQDSAFRYFLADDISVLAP